MKACLISNPASGSFSQAAIDRILASLSAHGVACTVLLTSRADEATHLAADNYKHCDLTIACGGDGTINEVVNGLPEGALLAVIPMGSVNVLAKELGLSTIEQAIDAIVRGQRRPMSLGLLEIGETRRRFFLMAGVGADGKAVENLQLAEKKELGSLAYVKSALRQLWNWDSGLARAQVDDRSFSFHTMMVCNASHYGGSFIMAHNTSIFKPEFEVVYTDRGSRPVFLDMCARLILSKPQKCRLPGSSVQIEGHKAIQVDGEFIGYSPARIRILPDFLHIVC